MLNIKPIPTRGYPALERRLGTNAYPGTSQGVVVGGDPPWSPWGGEGLADLEDTGFQKHFSFLYTSGQFRIYFRTELLIVFV